MFQAYCAVFFCSWQIFFNTPPPTTLTEMSAMIIPATSVKAHMCVNIAEICIVHQPGIKNENPSPQLQYVFD